MRSRSHLPRGVRGAPWTIRQVTMGPVLNSPSQAMRGACTRSAKRRSLWTSIITCLSMQLPHRWARIRTTTWHQRSRNLYLTSRSIQTCQRGKTRKTCYLRLKMSSAIINLSLSIRLPSNAAGIATERSLPNLGPLDARLTQARPRGRDQASQSLRVRSAIIWRMTWPSIRLIF